MRTDPEIPQPGQTRATRLTIRVLDEVPGVTLDPRRLRHEPQEAYRAMARAPTDWVPDEPTPRCGPRVRLERAT
jgi:hypothetical protein